MRIVSFAVWLALGSFEFQVSNFQDLRISSSEFRISNTPLSPYTRPSTSLRAGSPTPLISSPRTPIPPYPTIWLPLNEALKEARRLNKKVLVFVDAPWCGWCKKMDAAFFDDPGQMAKLTEFFVPTRLSIEDNETSIRFQGRRMSPADLCERLGAVQTPATIFLDEDGRHITTFPSYAEPDFYRVLLAYIGSDAYQTTAWEMYVAQNEP